MAISKDQPLRPYVQAVGDAVDVAQGDISTLTDNINANARAIADEIDARIAADSSLQDQIGDGFSETTITSALNTLSGVVQGIGEEIGNGFSSDSTVTDAVSEIGLAITAIQGWQNRFRLGLTESLEVEAGHGVSNMLTFNTPFPDDSEIAVFVACVADNQTLTGISCAVTSATYSSFVYDVFNNTAADVTIKVGFLAVRMD